MRKKLVHGEVGLVRGDAVKFPQTLSELFGHILA